MNILRWLVTGLVLAGLGVSGTLSARRVGGWALRHQADSEFVAGRMTAALDTYERARRWDPWAATVDTDLGDTAAYALAYRVAPLDRDPARAAEVALRGVDAYVRAVASAPPGGWSWAGIARLYENLRDYRLRVEGLDLSRLGADPLENLLPEDRLAEAALLHSLSTEPQNYFYLDSLGELYWRRGLTARALVPFERAVETYPIIEGHYYIGDLIGGSPELADAVGKGLARARQAFGANETWVVAREEGHLARSRGRLEEAGRHFEEAINRARTATPRELATLFDYLSETQEALGRLPAAADSLRRAIELEPDSAMLHAKLGLILGTEGRHAEAMQELGLARGLRPEDELILGAITRECGRANDLDGAERAYREIIRLRPDRVEPYLAVIDLLRAGGEFERAIPFARDLVRLHPREPLYRQQLDLLYAAGEAP